MEEKKKEVNIFKILWWSSKFGFEIDPVLYTLKFLTSLPIYLLPILEAFLTSKIIEEIIFLVQKGDTAISTNLYTWLFLSIANLVLIGLFVNLNEYITVRYNYVYTLRSFSLYLKQLVAIDVQYHEDPGFKSLIERAKDVINWRLISVINRIQGLVVGLISLIFVLYIFFAVNPIFILAILIPIMLNYYVNVKFGAEVYYIWEYGGEEAKHINNSIKAFDDKSLIHEAKIYGFGSYIISIYEKFSKFLAEANIKKSKERYSLLTLAEFLRSFIFGVIQFQLIYQVIAKVISIQQYTFYLQSIGIISRTFNGLQENISFLIENARFIGSLNELFTLEKRLKEIENPIKVENKAPLIEFRNVSFKYPSSQKFILKNVTFTISSGEHVALVGVNGAGKSTIIKLLARFYDATGGEILINGVNIKELDIDSYYQLWGILFQNFAKYWLSARENIGLGSIRDIENIELISKASRKSGADKIVKNLEFGYETLLSTDMEGGVDLSGGQWQKIGIARGLFSDPKLIILDEPTSALDAISEAEVFDNLSKISKNTTMVIVSHRFSTVRNADRIIVLDKGVILEQGTHQELMKIEGLYHEMFTSQAKGYTEE